MNPDQIQTYVEMGLQIVGLAAMASTIVPMPSKVTGALPFIVRVLNIVAFNFGNARNQKQ
jgi:hypothetical protein